MRRGPRLGIWLRLTLIILFISLFPLGFLGYNAYDYQKHILLEEVTESHIELSNTLAHGIYEKLEFIRKLLDSVTSIEAIRSLDEKVALDFFQALMQHHQLIRLMYLIDENRNIIATTDSERKLPEDWLYSQAIRRSYHGSLSEVFTCPEGERYITFESIVQTPQHHGITGVLIAEINLKGINKLLSVALNDSKAEGYIIDELGQVIARSCDDLREVRLSAAFETEINKLETVNGEDYLITAVSLKKFDLYQAPNWVIVLQTPAHKAFSSAFRFRDRIIRIFSITTLVSLFLAVFLARSFIAPISNLVKGARKIISGNFDYELIPLSDDEIGDLTSTFDQMRESLKETQTDLEYRILQLSTLNEVGKAINSVLDFKKLQNIILETVIKVIKAQKGSLMLVDDSERSLTIGVAVGLSDEIAQNTRLEAGDAIAGKVMQTRKPLFVRNTAEDEEFIMLKRGHIKAGTMMCAPLQAKEKILGVLNVSCSKPDAFSAKDFKLFIDLANHASIAIENARLYRYAVTDSMTRLYNHRYFQQRLDEELLRADRYENRVSLIMLDVDHFKKFNDTYGHPEGDRALKIVAQVIEKSIREIDIAARYGGEEFVVICPEKGGEGAMAPAERIRAAVEQFDYRIEGKPVSLSVSLGISCYPEQAKNKKELLKFSDSALYYSKQSGRNRVTLYNPILVGNDSSKTFK